MHTKLTLKTTFWLAALCTLPVLHATNIQVSLAGMQFAGANDGPFYLDFTLTGTAGNSADLSGFNFGTGHPVPGTSAIVGTASGSLSTDILLADGPSSFYNDFYQEFTPGSTLQFSINMTNINSSTPDTLTISLLDSSTLPVPTLDPSDANTLLTITLGSSPQYAAYASDTSQSTSDLEYPVILAPTVTAVSAAPEPSTWMYGALGLGAFFALRRRHLKGTLAAILGVVSVASASAQTCKLLNPAGGSPISIVAGQEASAVALGDFDGDGIPDMAVATSATSSGTSLLAVFKGNGSGGFTPFGGSPYTLSSTLMNAGDAFSMAAADFNRDGKLDLILSSDSGPIILILGAGNGQFNVPATATISATVGPVFNPQIQVADLNGDGYPDLIVNIAASTEVILNSAGTLVAGQLVPGERLSWLADVNGDGFPDIVGFTGKIYLNNTHGSYAFSGVTLTLPAYSDRPYIVSGNFTGHGHTDLLFVGSTPSNLSMEYELFAGDGAGNYGATPVVQTNISFDSAVYTFNVATGDFNGDGLLDFAFTQRTANDASQLYVYQNTGGSAFATASGSPYALGGNGLDAEIAVLDINGDGRPDIVTTSTNSSQNTGDVYVFVSNAESLSIGLTTSANPAITSTSLTLTAVVGGFSTACAAPTGHINYTVDGGNPITTIISGGKSSTTLPAGLTAGVHTITAAYSGDSNFKAVSASYVQLVGSSACSANLIGQVTVKPGGFVFDRVHQQFVQSVSITNNGPGAITGPVSLALDSLSSNASLVSPSGYTSCSAPANSPMADLGICPNTPLAAGGTTTVSLRFADPTLTAITYTARVLGGLSLR